MHLACYRRSRSPRDGHERARAEKMKMLYGVQDTAAAAAVRVIITAACLHAVSLLLPRHAHVEMRYCPVLWSHTHRCRVLVARGLVDNSGMRYCDKKRTTLPAARHCYVCTGSTGCILHAYCISGAAAASATRTHCAQSAAIAEHTGSAPHPCRSVLSAAVGCAASTVILQQ